MSTLILKLNATGDVVRTTPLLRVLPQPVTWVTASRNMALIAGVWPGLRSLPWEQRERARDGAYELLLNLEDEIEVAAFARTVETKRTFGAWLDDDGGLGYTKDSSGWFDMSLISRFGRQRADELKLHNRRSYQSLVFEGLGAQFSDEAYVLPEPTPTSLVGDVALATASGPVWPMKHWAFYPELRSALEARGLTVNVLPTRPSLLEHLGDIANHRCVVGGDSLPMHLAVGLGVRAVAIFNCTSPWEIHDYGLLTKLVSTRLAEFFYRRDDNADATSAIPLAQVLDAVNNALA